MKDNIRLSKSVIGIEEIEAVTNVLKKEYLGMGEEVFKFENELSSFIGRPSVCVNTGTSALQLAIQACDIGKGDEILVQSLTYLASFQAISATGANPSACEVNSKDLTIDLDDAQKRLTKNTKAIMPVHFQEIWKFRSYLLLINIFKGLRMLLMHLVLYIRKI